MTLIYNTGSNFIKKEPRIEYIKNYTRYTVNSTTAPTSNAWGLYTALPSNLQFDPKMIYIGYFFKISTTPLNIGFNLTPQSGQTSWFYGSVFSELLSTGGNGSATIRSAGLERYAGTSGFSGAGKYYAYSMGPTGSTGVSNFSTRPTIIGTEWCFLQICTSWESLTAIVSGLDFVRINGVNVAPNTMLRGNAGNISGQNNTPRIYPIILSTTASSNISFDVAGLVVNWFPTTTPPQPFNSWAEYCDSFCDYSNYGRPYIPSAEDNIIRMISDGPYSTTGQISGNLTRTSSSVTPTTYEDDNIAIVKEPSGARVTNAIVKRSNMSTSINFEATARYNLAPSSKMLFISVFKFTNGKNFRFYYPQYTIKNGTAGPFIIGEDATSGFFLSYGDVVINKVPLPSPVPPNGWWCFIGYIDPVLANSWASINKAAVTGITSGSRIFNAPDGKWLVQQTSASNTTTIYENMSRYVAFYDQATIESLAIDFSNRVAVEDLFYENGKSLKSDLANAINGAKPFIFLDADSPRGWGLIRPNNDFGDASGFAANSSTTSWLMADNYKVGGPITVT